MRCARPLVVSLGLIAALGLHAVVAPTQQPPTRPAWEPSASPELPAHMPTLEARSAPSVSAGVEPLLIPQLPPAADGEVEADPFSGTAKSALRHTLPEHGPGAPAAPGPWLVSQIRVRPDGRLVARVTELDPEAARASGMLAYDLSALTPSRLAEGPGGGVASLGSDPLRARWWRQLASAIVERVDLEPGEEDQIGLAWDDARSLLLVVQDPTAREAIEGVLDVMCVHQQCAVRLRVSLTGSHPVDSAVGVDLDVPSQIPVEASAGRAWTYVADQDIEISMSTHLAGPVLEMARSGLQVSALRTIFGSDLVDRLQIEIKYRPTEVRFLDLPTPSHLAGPPELPLERPFTTPLAWRGSVSTAAATVCVVSLGAGHHCRIEVESRGVPASRAGTPRGWRRVSLPVGGPSLAAMLVPQSPPDLRVRRLSLHGSASGVLGAGVLPGRLGVALVAAVLRAGSDAWLAAGHDAVVRPHAYPQSLACGELRVTVLASSGGSDPAWIDVWIEAGAWTGDVRWRQLWIPASTPEHGAWLHAPLPSADRVSTCRRIELSRAGVGQVAFDADLGRGPERLTLRMTGFAPAR